MNAIVAFLAMLSAERGSAKNSLLAYERDIEDYVAFLESRGANEISATSADIRAFLARLAEARLQALLHREAALGPASISRLPQSRGPAA